MQISFQPSSTDCFNRRSLKAGMFEKRFDQLIINRIADSFSSPKTGVKEREHRPVESAEEMLIMLQKSE